MKGLENALSSSRREAKRRLGQHEACSSGARRLLRQSPGILVVDGREGVVGGDAQIARAVREIKAVDEPVGRLALLTRLFGLAQDLLTLLTLVGTLLAFSPLLFVLLIAAVVPAFLGETHYAALGYSLLYQWTPERRKLDYYRWVAASDTTAKEVKLFGLGPASAGDYFHSCADASGDFVMTEGVLRAQRSSTNSGEQPEFFYAQPEARFHQMAAGTAMIFIGYHHIGLNSRLNVSCTRIFPAV